MLVDPCAGTGRALAQDGFFGKGAALASLQESGSRTGAEPSGDDEDAIAVRQQTLDGLLATEPLLFAECSAIVGLHPDEATEGIVDLALRHQKPFAIVPCCVLENLFGSRRRKSGRRVKKLGAFIEYLREKDWRIQTAELDFPGRNEVLFMCPNDYKLPEEMPTCSANESAAGQEEEEEEEEEEEDEETFALDGGAAVHGPSAAAASDSSYQADRGWSDVLSGPVPPELTHLSKARLKKELRHRARQARKKDPVWKGQRRATVPHKQQKAIGEMERRNAQLQLRATHAGAGVAPTPPE